MTWAVSTIIKAEKFKIVIFESSLSKMLLPGLAVNHITQQEALVGENAHSWSLSKAHRGTPFNEPLPNEGIAENTNVGLHIHPQIALKKEAVCQNFRSRLDLE